ncbi:MAG: ribonuclease Z, partial [Lachnospiraceae bacterium]|nr:ribonuclease Z [Lachnospiraceae bacterium]
MTFAEAAKIAAKADPQPKEMWLTHYSPSLIRPEEFMDPVREIFPNAFAAKDLRSTVIKFEEE